LKFFFHRNTLPTFGKATNHEPARFCEDHSEIIAANPDSLMAKMQKAIMQKLSGMCISDRNYVLYSQKLQIELGVQSYLITQFR
jgi:hypothetical protein